MVDGSAAATAADESEVNELVRAVVDTSVADATTSHGSGSVSTLSFLARLGNECTLAVFLMMSTISCPFKFLVKFS